MLQASFDIEYPTFDVLRSWNIPHTRQWFYNSNIELSPFVAMHMNKKQIAKFVKIRNIDTTQVCLASAVYNRVHDQSMFLRMLLSCDADQHTDIIVYLMLMHDSRYQLFSNYMCCISKLSRRDFTMLINKCYIGHVDATILMNRIDMRIFDKLKSPYARCICNEL